MGVETVPQITVLIPCLNEAETIERAVRKALDGLAAAGLSGAVLVSDNGSTDGTPELALKAGARVAHAPVRGYGAALHFGFLQARTPWVIFGDADLSYDFSSLEDFARALREDKHDMVLGSRLGGVILPGAMPLLNRHLGTPALNLAIRLFFGLPTSDCNSGMRLVRREFYRSLPMRSTGMEWASELLIKGQLAGMRYAEVPICYHKDQRSRAPHLRRWRDGWRHLKTIVLLSPERLLGVPALLAAATAVSLASRHRWTSALISSTAAATALAMALLIGLIQDGDGVRRYSWIRWLRARPTAEVLLSCGLCSSLLGGVLFVARVGEPLFSAVLINLGLITVLTACGWGALITHSLKSLENVASLPLQPEKPRQASQVKSG